MVLAFIGQIDNEKYMGKRRPFLIQELRREARKMKIKTDKFISSGFSDYLYERQKIANIHENSQKI